MATILKGKNKGQEVAIHQWCNDWFMVGDGQIVSPTNLQLNLDEMKRVLEHHNNGMLFGWFELQLNGRFKRVTSNMGPR